VVAKSIPPTLSRGTEHGALNDQARCFDGGFEAWSQRRGVGCLTPFPPRRILHGHAAILILMSPHVCRRTIFTTCSPPSLRLLHLPTILPPPPPSPPPPPLPPNQLRLCTHPSVPSSLSSTILFDVLGYKSIVPPLLIGRFLQSLPTPPD
jgi:hypothetical protein